MSRSQAQQLLARALALHQGGRLNEAAMLYEQVLQSEPRNFDALHLLGIVSAQTGNFQRAVDLIGKAIKINPLVPIAHNNRGNALKDLGQFEIAIANYNKAIALDPNYADAFYNRGIAMEGLGQPGNAVKSYDRAISLKPGMVTAHFNRGNALKDLGQFDSAVESYDRAISLKPDYAEAYSNRGAVLVELQQYEQAVQSCERAISLMPGLISAHFNRGNALRNLGRLEAAIDSYDRAVEINPGYAQAYCNRGVTLEKLQKTADALANYDRAIALKPDLSEAYCNKGNALRELKQFVPALENLEKAIALKPDFAQAFYNRGNALADMGRYEIAVQSYASALAVKPDIDFLRGTLLYSRLQLCDWSTYEIDVRKIMAGVQNGEKIVPPFAFLALSDSLHLQRRVAEIWAKARYVSTPLPWPSPAPRNTDRIRIAYLSADFQESPPGYNLAGYFEAHDRTRFESFAISFGPATQSPLRQRLKAAFDHFIEMRGKSDEEIARKIRKLQIDIAVDISGPVADQREGVFALRCAPIQANLFGWTSGAGYMDYIVADSVVLPPGFECHFTEKVVRVPCSYFALDNKRTISSAVPTRSAVGLPDSSFVFCAFNNSFKITPANFEMWMRFLHRLPDSVLWLRENNPSMAKTLKVEAQNRGIAETRIIFAPRMPSMADHLARHCLADLFLDNFPFGAHTTASDALWAGLPIVTCTGEAITSRIGASLLHAIEMPELVTRTPEEYELRVIELASNPLMLAEIRRKLQHNRLRTALFDTQRQSRHLNAAFEAMYERHHAGLPPDHIQIDNMD